MAHRAVSRCHGAMDSLFVHHLGVMAFKTQLIHTIRLDKRTVIAAMGIVTVLTFTIFNSIVHISAILLILMTLETAHIILGKIELVVSRLNVTCRAVILYRAVQDLHFRKIDMTFRCDALLRKQFR